ncbi:hypothetical protein [Plasmodium yoelii yoelii]|uniref:Uncharacterized protein n=1 Tax=Plasmodium yoelii yoelii TaxID=73239 RepID=Q7RPW1_PLAYO|nr:hypothetical protein [Plasmodium yoelii yoelii]
MKNKENDKYRILCFQKGSGRLFLNTDIFEGFKIIPSKKLSALFNGRDIVYISISLFFYSSILYLSFFLIYLKTF